MEKNCLHFSQIIASSISEQLTSHMEAKSLISKNQKERPQKIKEFSAEFSLNMIDRVANLNEVFAKRSKEQEEEFLNAQSTLGSNSIIGKRVSILKVRRQSSIESKFSSFGNSKKSSRLMKNSSNGLIRLRTEIEEPQDYAEFIEKLRQRKNRYAEIMSQQREPEIDISKYKRKGSKKAKRTFATVIEKEKVFVTTFTGEKLKQEKKEFGLKKDMIYTDKAKVKPLFRLKEFVGSRKELNKTNEIAPEYKRTSFGKSKDKEELIDDNYFIKAMIDVILTKKKNEENKNQRVLTLR